MKPIIILYILAVILGLSGCQLMIELDPPEVSNIYTTAESFMVNPGDTALFWVEATDPQNETLSYLWTLAVGEIIGSAQRDTLHWKAPLSGGEFLVLVEVSNSEKSVTRSDNITVISFVRPYVKIINPSANEYLVQYQPTTITAQAFHENGLTQVQLWINNTLITSQSGTPALAYQFGWDASAAAGLTEIKVSAVSKITALTGSDSIRIPLEGIIRGKK